MAEDLSNSMGAAGSNRRLASMIGQSGGTNWPDDIRRAAATTDEDLFSLYVGPNAGKFAGLYRAIVDGEGRRWSFNWIVLFAALPWFFYRRMYLFGILLLVIPVAVGFVLPQAAQLGAPGIAVVLAVLANRWYVSGAIEKIERIKALNLPDAERNERIQDAGGVSPAGAIFGVLIVFALVAIPFMSRSTVALPGCDTGEVQQLTEKLLSDNLKKAGVRAMGLKLEAFETVHSAFDGTAHVCRFTANLGRETEKLFVGVTWRDRAAGEYEVNLGPTRDSVSP